MYIYIYTSWVAVRSTGRWSPLSSPGFLSSLEAPVEHMAALMGPQMMLFIGFYREANFSDSWWIRRQFDGFSLETNWLVVEPPLWTNMKVSWDDYSPIDGKMKNMFQTTNQPIQNRARSSWTNVQALGNPFDGDQNPKHQIDDVPPIGLAILHISAIDIHVAIGHHLSDTLVVETDAKKKQTHVFSCIFCTFHSIST